MTKKRQPRRCAAGEPLSSEQKAAIADAMRRAIDSSLPVSPFGLSMPVPVPVPVPVSTPPQGSRGEALKSTVLLSAQAAAGGDLLAFSSTIGSPLPGGGDQRLVCSLAETNMRVANMFVQDPMTVREIWYDIPRVAEARFQIPLPCGRCDDYILRVEDVRQIVTTTYLRFCIGGDRPVFQAALSFAESAPNVPGDALMRGVFKLPLPYEIGRVAKFWVELSWPTTRPVFGKLCGDAYLTARIPVAIYLVP